MPMIILLTYIVTVYKHRRSIIVRRSIAPFSIFFGVSVFVFYILKIMNYEFALWQIWDLIYTSQVLFPMIHRPTRRVGICISEKRTFTHIKNIFNDTSQKWQRHDVGFLFFIIYIMTQRVLICIIKNNDLAIWRFLFFEIYMATRRVAIYIIKK